MLRYAKESGYFLIITLVFIHLFSLITLNELSRLKNEMKLSKISWQTNIDHIYSDYVLSSIEKKLANEKVICIIKPQSSDQIKNHHRNWWQQVGCMASMMGRNYYYVVEPLRRDPCAEIDDHGQQKRGLIYYQVSVLLKETQNILQAIIAIHDNTENCAGILHQRTYGRQLWREL